MDLNSLIAKIKLRLGDRKIDVNLTDEDIMECIEDGVNMFTYWHYDGTVMKAYRLAITTDVEYVLPNYVKSVIGYYRPNEFTTPTLSRLVLTELNIMYESSNLINFQVFKDYMQTVDRVLLPKYDYRFNETLHTIYFRSKPAPEEQYMYLAIYEDISVNNIESIYENNWFVRYTVELSRLKWAQMIGKYSKKLTNGATVNWENMQDMAERKIEALEIELKTERRIPTDFFVD